jgi:hypothetical protein
MTREQIKLAAMELDPVEREALAEELLLSLSETDRSGIEQAWLTEAKRRDAECMSGTIAASTVEEALGRIERKRGG